MLQQPHTPSSTTSPETVDEVFERHGHRYTRVRSLEHLKHLANAGDGESIAEFSLVLNAGARRSKLVQYAFSKNGRHWYVDDMDDGDGGYYTDKQLHRLTMIPKGIAAGCFYLEELLPGTAHTAQEEPHVS